MKLLGHSLLMAAGLAASVAHAVEPTVYQLGDGGAVAPHLALEFGSDNNPLRAEEGSDPSVFFRLQPSVDYLVQRRNNRLTLGYQGDYYQYFTSYCDTADFRTDPGDCSTGGPEFNKASYQDHAISLDGFVEVTSRLRGVLNLAYNIDNQPLGTGLSSNLGALNELTETEYWSRASARAELSYGANQARGEVQLGIRLLNQELSSERNIDLDAQSDTQVAPYGRLLYRLGSRTQVFAGAGYNQIRDSVSFGGGNNFERNISRFSIGATLAAQSVTSGTVSIGFVNEDFLASEDDLSYASFDANIIWRPRTFSTVTFSAGRETGSGIVGDNFSLNTILGARWEHFWRERFSTTADFSFEFDEDIDGISDIEDEFDQSISGGEDRTVSFRFDANYNVRRWFDIGGFINIDSRTGATEERDYGRTVVGITANGTI